MDFHGVNGDDRRTVHGLKAMIGELFDPKSPILMPRHFRPHWSQAGAVVFITFRTHDSIPREVAERWELEKQEWLRVRGLGDGRHWRTVMSTLPTADRAEFLKTFRRCREVFLDSCHGSCPFRQPQLARIVADSLLHFDGDRYRMGDFVVMPNHVHLLAAFPSAESMGKQCDSWLHYTAVRINRTLGAKGKLWQEEPFDHLVRSADQYEYFRKYIAENPQKAKLRDGEYLYRRCEG